MTRTESEQNLERGKWYRAMWRVHGLEVAGERPVRFCVTDSNIVYVAKEDRRQWPRSIRFDEMYEDANGLHFEEPGADIVSAYGRQLWTFTNIEPL